MCKFFLNYLFSILLTYIFLNSTIYDTGEERRGGRGGGGGYNRERGERGGERGERGGERGGERRDRGEGGGYERRRRNEDDDLNNNNEYGDDGDKKREFYIPPEPTNDETEIFSSGITSGINFSKYDNIPVKVGYEHDSLLYR